MRYQNPAYTGQNRCWPCTMLNVGLAILVAGVLVGMGHLGIAIITVICGTFVIGLRGYLVPGTPTLTRKLPEPLLRIVKNTTSLTELPATEALIAVDVLDDDLSLATDTADSVCGRAEDLVSDPEMLESVALDVIPDAVEITVRRSLNGGENWFVHNADQIAIHQWNARPIAAVDVASAEYLSTILPNWEARSNQERITLLALIRYGIPRCPSCGTAFTEPNGPNVACCGGRSLVGKRRCETCEYALVDQSDLSLAVSEDEV